MTDPTPQDIRNAAVRAEIAERQQAEWDRVFLWALSIFGAGFEPSGRHFLLDKAHEDECRRTGQRPIPAATVFTARHSKTGEKRHFTIVDGRPRECASYEDGFGEMLNERHPTMRIEVKGEQVAPHRYSLCWAAIETYRPQTADVLAARREKRQERAVEKEAQSNPLYADDIRAEGFVRKGRTP